MSGMPLVQALLLLAAVVILVLAIERRWLHPFLAIVAVGSAFALAAGYSTGFLGKTFGTGFSQAAYAPGLLIVAAALVAGIAESTGAPTRIAGRIAQSRWLGSALGMVAGLAWSPTAAFALLAPLLRARGAGMVASALALSASHGLLLVSPIPIVAASILGAGYGRVALIGVPVAILTVAAGAVWARWTAPRDEASPSPAHDGGTAWPAFVLITATAIPILMLMAQSLGEIPSEPLGGGSARATIIGLGQVLVLLLLTLGIAVAGLWRLSRPLLADAAWTARILGDVAPLVLTVAAAAGLQRLCQETGMAELLGERLLGWHAGLLLPFLVAAVVKTLQGSSLVAAITAAGMIQPLLGPLGLDSESGRALAALALGAGAMTASHANDEYFWLVTGSTGIGPARGLIAITGGTLVQGIVAVAALMMLSATL